MPLTKCCVRIYCFINAMNIITDPRIIWDVDAFTYCNPIMLRKGGQAIITLLVTENIKTHTSTIEMSTHQKTIPIKSKKAGMIR